MTPMINNNVNSLSPTFRKKFDLWRAEVITKYPNAVVFEARRSQERQSWLYSQWRTRPWKIITWTLNSNHKDWNAVDIVFRNNGRLEWVWPYNDLIEIAKKYWIRNLAPRELCHFEDDGTPYAHQVEIDKDIQTLVDDWIFNWNYEPMDNKRIIKIIAKLYNKVK